MLTDIEKHEIEEEFPRYEDRRAVCIEAMKIVQRHRGWVSDEDLKDIADFIGMTKTELDGVATFYNLIFRKPVGKHKVLLCDSITCWIMGYAQLREHLKQSLGIEMGGTTPDNKFTLLPIVCLGDCDHAPTMMVDDDLHHDLTPDKVNEILTRYD